MMVASEAEEAWCPPTFTPSTFSRRWLAWWMVQLASHSTFFSSSPRIASSFALGLVSAPSAIGTIFTALRGEAKSAEAANLGEPLGTSARKADKSACAAYFCVDSRNENLPEKCIHQNYASRPGGSCCRFLLRACERRRCGFGWGLKGTTWGFQTEAYLVWPAHIPQPSVVEVARRRCVPCSGLLFTGSHTTFPCSPGLNARAATGSRPTAQAATAPEGPGGRRRADRPSSAPAWASLPAAVCIPRCRTGRRAERGNESRVPTTAAPCRANGGRCRRRGTRLS